MNNPEENRNNFINEEDRVIIFDSFAEEVIYGLESKWSEHKEVANKFSELFENVQEKGRKFLAEKENSFGRGISVISVIRRKSDGRLFGFEYWEEGDDSQFEPNASENNLEFEPPRDFDWENDYFPMIYVWLPVEPFTITGYKVQGK